MQAILAATLLIAVFSQASAARADWFVGNGGDGITCADEPGAPFSGFLSLDYVLTFNRQNNNSDINSAPGSLDRIAAKLMEITSYTIGQNFKFFLQDARAQIGSAPNPTVAHLWQPDSLREYSINDEQLISNLPSRCLVSGPQGQAANLKQLVVRQWRQNVIKYFYDADAVATLRANEQQFSFLLVHEFLWDYSTNASIVRDATRFLHTSAIDTMTGTEVMQRLEQYGVRIHPRPVKIDTPVSITAGSTPSGLISDKPELHLSWPNFLVSNRVVIHNNTGGAIIYGDYALENTLDHCYPGSHADPGGEMTLGAEGDRGQYFWVAKWDDQAHWECPPEDQRLYIYIREVDEPTP